MIEVTLDTRDLLKWARYLHVIADATPRNIANALNSFGRNVRRSMVQYIADQTGLEPSFVDQGVLVYEASANDLNWELDASDVVADNAEQWRRPWQSNQSDPTFNQQFLLNIVTQPNCCDICEQAAENSPYTAEEISNMAATWSNFTPADAALQLAPVTNLLHPNCHCVTVPWDQTRRQLPMSFGNSTPQAFTADQLGRELAREILDNEQATFRAVIRS